jgi:hypothetical protein
MARKRPTPEQTTVITQDEVTDSRKPLVFISHDTRDADIAEAFTNLLTDASGGILQSFRSSDRKGVSGIEFGAEWYRTIMERIENATDVVALLTSYSINRPWILYEAGVAKGKLDRVVFGVALGIPLTEANVGPFAQFQNSGDDEDSLTKLVLQLIRRNPDAAPREEAVRRQVIAFREIAVGLLEGRQETTASAPAGENETEDVAKLFEEVKVMFRELPDRLEGTMKSHLRRAGGSRRKLRPGLIHDFVFSATHLEPQERVTSWLIATTSLRDDFPWIYEMLLEANQAVRRNDVRGVKELARSLHRMLNSKHVDYMLYEAVGEDIDRSILSFVHNIPELLDQLARDMPVPVRRNFSVAGRVKEVPSATEEKE